MRLIDADAFIKMMEEKCDHTASLDEWVLAVCRGGIKAMPTIETQPKTGEWDMRYDDDAPQDGIWYCSVCGYYRLLDDISPQYFCPNCGARMLNGR